MEINSITNNQCWKERNDVKNMAFSSSKSEGGSRLICKKTSNSSLCNPYYNGI